MNMKKESGTQKSKGEKSMRMTNCDSIQWELNKQELNKQSKGGEIFFGGRVSKSLHPILNFLICDDNRWKRWQLHENQLWFKTGKQGFIECLSTCPGYSVSKETTRWADVLLQ